MKLSIIVLALVLTATPALGEDLAIPNGCYVAFSNPGYCFSGPVGTALTWIDNDGDQAITNRYGSILGTVIIVSRQNQELYESCHADYNSLVDLYDAQAAKIKKLKKQIKKLKAGR